MSDALEELKGVLKTLPGLGYRSAERIALHLLVEKKSSLEALSETLRRAAEKVTPCPRCGNLSQNGDLCAICSDPQRQQEVVCVVETVQDLMAIDRSSAWRGTYHVLHGKLSPLRGIGPEELHMEALVQRVESGVVTEVVLALPNDVEGEATCHYIMEKVLGSRSVACSRIGFGLPSGGEVTFADPLTLRTALEGRKVFR